MTRTPEEETSALDVQDVLDQVKTLASAIAVMGISDSLVPPSIDAVGQIGELIHSQVMKAQKALRSQSSSAQLDDLGDKQIKAAQLVRILGDGR